MDFLFYIILHNIFYNEYIFEVCIRNELLLKTFPVSKLLAYCKYECYRDLILTFATVWFAKYEWMNEWMNKGEANYGPCTATLKIYCASPSTSPLQQPHTSDEV
jgi:hypothetical protein